MCPEEAEDPVEVLVGTRGKWMFVKDDCLNKKILCHSTIQDELGKEGSAGETGRREAEELGLQC